MRLLQIKLRGLGDLPITSWITLNKSLTLLRFSDVRVGRAALRAVQTLNPPYECESEEPFGDLPHVEVLTNGYRRAVIPGKRTIVIGIFDTPAALVRDLGAVTAPLYETDRVEVGRRLDYSRWTNFVEISSSSRWSEVSEDIGTLLKQYSDGPESQAIERLVTDAVPADRLKGVMAEQLAAWLASLEPHQSEIDCYPDIIEKVQRADKFAEARALLNRRLPQFLIADGDDMATVFEPETEDSGPQSTPVMLIDCLDAADPGQTGAAVPKQIASLAKRRQCLCFAVDRHAGWDLPAAQVTDVVALN